MKIVKLKLYLRNNLSSKEDTKDMEVYIFQTIDDFIEYPSDWIDELITCVDAKFYKKLDSKMCLEIKDEIETYLKNYIPVEEEE